MEIYGPLLLPFAPEKQGEARRALQPPSNALKKNRFRRTKQVEETKQFSVLILAFLIVSPEIR